MFYIGSKQRYASRIARLFPSALNYYEPFLGGGGMASRLCKDKYKQVYLSDINPYIIDFFSDLKSGWLPKDRYSKAEYIAMKSDLKKKTGIYTNANLCFVGYNYSFKAKWWSGFVGDKWLDKFWRGRSGLESINNVLSFDIELAKKENVIFACHPYHRITPLAGDVVYCDPPYAGTLGYGIDFDHNQFWQWCRDLSSQGVLVYISEQKAPPDFKCLLEIVPHMVKGYTNKRSGNEKVFIPDGQTVYGQQSLFY